MSWEAKRERLDELIKKDLIEEPYLDLPVIGKSFGIDDQLDMLDSLVYDALLEEDSPSLRVIEPKIVQWIDGLEDFEEEQFKIVPNSYVPGEPGQQKQLQPKECDICGRRFEFPVNLKRHKWRPCYKAKEKNMESAINQFKDYWEKLEHEKACKVISMKDAVLPVNVTKLQLNNIFGAVFSYVEESDEEHTSVIAFLLNSEAADDCPSFQEILDALHFLSDETFFCGTPNLEMQKIVFPHALSMDEIREQGLLASFGYLVEYCMIKAWADVGIYIDDPFEDEEAARKQT